MPDKFAELPCPLLQDSAAWEDLWVSHLPAWRQLIALARRRVLKDPSRAVAVTAQCPVLVPCGPQLDDGDEQDEFLCGSCELTFSTCAGELVHTARMHGSGANTAVKAYVESSRCPACQRDVSYDFVNGSASEHKRK